MTQDEVADLILNILGKQHFADWYQDSFIAFIEGCDENAPTQEVILEQIKKIFQVDLITPKVKGEDLLRIQGRQIVKKSLDPRAVLPVEEILAKTMRE